MTRPTDPYLSRAIKQTSPKRKDPRADNQSLFEHLDRRGVAEQFIERNLPLCVKAAERYVKRHPCAAPYKDDLIADGFVWLTDFVRRVQDGELTVNSAKVGTYMIVGLRRHLDQRNWGYLRMIAVPRRSTKRTHPKVLQGEAVMRYAADTLSAPDQITAIDAFDFLTHCCKSLLEYQIALARLAGYAWNEIAERFNLTRGVAKWRLRYLRERYQARARALLRAKS